MSITRTFAERIDRKTKTADDLMNWIIFGDNERFYSKTEGISNTF